MVYNSRRTYESKKYPGVVMTYRTMSSARRSTLGLELAASVCKLRDAMSALSALDLPRDETGAVDQKAKLDVETSRALADIVDQVEEAKREIAPSYMKVCFVSVDGLTLDGVTMDLTAEALRLDGPEDLYYELAEHIRRDSEMSDEERQNLESPTTSAAQADGRTSGTNAADAEPADTTRQETAGSTSPAT